MRIPFSRRLLVGSILLAVFVLCDVALFGWLLFRSMSEREISRVLLETREDAEELASQIEEGAAAREDDLYLAVATERETQTYIDSVLRQRDIVRTVEIRDERGRLVYRIESDEMIPADPQAGPVVASPEGGPEVEERQFERQFTYDVYDLSVPIGDLGEIRIGISREQMERRIGVLREELLRQAGIVGAVTLAVLLTAYLVIWWLVRRGRILQTQAAEAERMAYIGTLAAGLAHEIRNPLNSLSLNMQMLEEDLQEVGSPVSTRRLLGITRREIGRLERLVTDFLSYARPRPVELDEVAVGEVLQHVRAVVAERARRAGAEVRVENPCEEDPESERRCIRVDEQQIKQLMLNLAANAVAAVEAAGGGGAVVLRARELGDRLALEVEDDGVGIPEEERERIFEVFHSTRKGGTGLGLAIVERIARNHDAELEVESRVGKGTTVRVHLPATRCSRQRRGDVNHTGVERDRIATPATRVRA